jgi:zinc protease
MVIERRSLPLVTVRVMVRAGSAADPVELPGLARMVAAVLDQGTARRSGPELAETVDRVGGLIQTGVSWDTSFLALAFLAPHAELAMELAAEIATAPAFPREEFERRRRQTLSALEVLRDDPSYVADQVFDRLVFAGTPYGHPPEGTPDSLARMTERDLAEFHRRHFRPENSILAVVGDVGEAQAFAWAERCFGQWPRGQGSDAAPRARAPATDRQLVVIDRPDSVQTEIRVGGAGPARASDDYLAVNLANQVVGGPAANRLFRALRSRQGLTYGASSELNSFRSGGSWVAKTSTRTPETIRALDLLLETWTRFRDRPVGSGELRAAQSYLVGNLALEFETSDQLASRTLELMAHDLPADEWNRFAARVESLSAESVLTATRRYLDRGRVVIVLVGNAREFENGLRRFGRARVIPVSELDLNSPTLRRRAAAGRKGT